LLRGCGQCAEKQEQRETPAKFDSCH
jgi:hypothetical protein